MVRELREKYNREFTQEKYQRFLDNIAEVYGYRQPFRIAETPIFVPRYLHDRLEEACREINEFFRQPNFKELSRDAIKHETLQVPGEDYHTRFLQMDFGICQDEAGRLYPQLIEVQGFPSLYFFQDMLAYQYKRVFDIPEYLTAHLNGMNSEEYIEMLRRIIVGDCDPRNVVLLEVEPEKQVTRIDFLGAARHLGIKVLCISKLKKRGRKLFYLDDQGREVPIYQIYNRVIFDELQKRTDLPREFYFTDEVDVEWMGHPNWFFRISKFIMPMLKSQYVPDCYYLHELSEWPEDLENFVLKPLYSFAGEGVKLHITAQDLDAIEDRENYILQRRVNYVPVIETPNQPAKCEIRMLMLWEKGHSSPMLVNNLVRLSKGEMVGVRYNKDKDWVGASIGFFGAE